MQTVSVNNFYNDSQLYLSLPVIVYEMAQLSSKFQLPIRYELVSIFYEDDTTRTKRLYLCGFSDIQHKSYEWSGRHSIVGLISWRWTWPMMNVFYLNRCSMLSLSQLWWALTISNLFMNGWGWLAWFVGANGDITFGSVLVKASSQHTKGNDLTRIKPSARRHRSKWHTSTRWTACFQYVTLLAIWWRRLPFLHLVSGFGSLAKCLLLFCKGRGGRSQWQCRCVCTFRIKLEAIHCQRSLYSFTFCVIGR